MIQRDAPIGRKKHNIILHGNYKTTPRRQRGRVIIVRVPHR